jgi:NAD(P)-dependent dehydrogenase (short-subunit alcohol dehydrogenase family)
MPDEGAACTLIHESVTPGWSTAVSALLTWVINGEKKWIGNGTIASRKQENVDNATATLRRTGASVVGVSADIRDLDAVTRAFDSTANHLGTIDVLVSGAAATSSPP